MATFRIIPARYLYIACLVLSFIMFSAGGVAFNQNAFYGALFIILATLLFIVGMHFGRKESDNV
jgi:lipopolysaccharide export LptBFGC system permease protein LptF